MKAPAAATAAPTRRSAPGLSAKGILISFWIDLDPNETALILYYEAKGRIGLVQASGSDSTPLLAMTTSIASRSGCRGTLHPTSRRFLGVAPSQKAVLYASGIDETVHDLAALIDP
jgi:hypothetical protein